MKTNTALVRHGLISALASAAILATTQANAVQVTLLQDTFVDTDTTGSPTPNNTNYGGNVNLRAQRNANHSCRSFIQFGLGRLPSGTTANDVNQAWLRIWVNNSTVATGLITLKPITSAWDENTIKNNNSSGMTYGTPSITDFSVTTSQDFVDIDVTTWVKAWINGTLTNNGIQIEASSSSTGQNLYFDSKESQNTSHEPQLEIVLNGPAGPQGPAGPTGATGLNWKGNWSGSTAYVVNDAVFSGGSAYVATRAHTNVQPPSSDTWNLIAQKGDTGAVGAQGPQGPAGATGAAGAQGPQGPAGATGAAGAQGPAGPAGATGANGAQGPAGPAGAQGPAGLNWKGSWSSSTAYVTKDAVFSGGSAYVALQSNNNVQPPASGTWDLLVQKGDTGAAGAQGATGANGAQGPAGPQGPAGADGAQGPVGAQGPQGPAGANGAAGPAGAEGPAGPAGADGAQGPAGPAGADGAQGPVGPQGEQGVPGAPIAIRYAYSTDTTNDNPGAGFVRFNAAVCGNATEVYISTFDADTNVWSSVLSSLADSSSATKGQLRFVNLTATHGTPVLFNVISVTEAPGYFVVSVAPLTAGYGPFSIDGEGALLIFTRTGDKGDIGLTGAAGAQGPQGAQGPAGDAGPAGPAGPQGVAGAQGPAGANGAQGPPGSQGPAGPQGPAGTAPTHIQPMGDLSMGDFTNGPTP
jgi:hypothetical protein